MSATQPTYRRLSAMFAILLCTLLVVLLSSHLYSTSVQPLLHTVNPSSTPRQPNLSTTSPTPNLTDLRPLLHLNTNHTIHCPHILYLRTPKTASSSLAVLFQLRNLASGPVCTRAVFPQWRYISPQSFTLCAADLLGPQASNANETEMDIHFIRSFTQYVSHMHYTVELRRLLDVNRLFRVASLRKPESRAASWLAHMKKYGPSDINYTTLDVRPMLEYIGGSNLLVQHREERINPNTPWTVIDDQITAVLNHWDLLMIAERYEDSLTVLMHALNWRLVDLVGLPINVHAQASSKTSVMQEGLSETEPDRRMKEFGWMLRVDSMLYERANKRLDEQLKKLPRVYDNVKEGVKLLTKMLGEKCKVSSTGKHYSAEDLVCVREFRENVLADVGVGDFVGDEGVTAEFL